MRADIPQRQGLGEPAGEDMRANLEMHPKVEDTSSADSCPSRKDSHTRDCQHALNPLTPPAVPL